MVNQQSESFRGAHNGYDYDAMNGVRDSITVLVSIEPRSYREAIGATLQVLRPHHKIASVEPCVLRDEVLRLDPQLVIAAAPNEITSNGTPAWMEYRPYDETPAQVCVGGHRREVASVDLDVLLAVVDEVVSAGDLRAGC